jgi:Ca-activated chloride channel family protein
VVPAGAEEGAYTKTVRTNRGNPATLRMPEESGEFELRYLLYQTRKAIASRPITLLPAEASLEAPESAGEGAEISITWTGPDNANDYITVVPAGSESGTYTNTVRTNRGNPATLRMPEDPGEYELWYVLYQTRKNVASRPIVILPAEASLEAPETAGIGAEISVIWTGPDNTNDYITVVPAGSEPGTYTNYVRTNKGSPSALRLPEEPGDYEIWYVLNQSRKNLAVRPIIITPTSATLEAAEQVTAGNEFTVTWTGPVNARDFITIVPVGAAQGTYKSYAYTERGSPSKIKAPDEAGDHEIRFVLGQSNRTLVSRPILVTPLNVELSVNGVLMIGTEADISYSEGGSPKDYITIVPVGTPEKQYMAYKYIQSGNPVRLKMPDTPGDYEIRYLTDQSGTTVARLAVVVMPVSANLEADESVAPSSRFPVNWTGPNSQGDFIAVAAIGSPPGQYIARALSAAGNPVNLFAPRDPGTYELRYVAGKGSEVLATRPLDVK